MAYSSPLTAIFRVSVVIGCATFLLGVAGIFYFQNRQPREVAPAVGKSAAVMLETHATSDDLEVVVRWAAEDGTAQEERGRRSREPATWLFDRAPQTIPVDLVVFRTTAGRRSELHRTQAVLKRGSLFQAILPR